MHLRQVSIIGCLGGLQQGGGGVLVTRPAETNRAGQQAISQPAVDVVSMLA